VFDKFKKGKESLVAHALSRKHNCLSEETCSTISVALPSYMDLWCGTYKWSIWQMQATHSGIGAFKLDIHPCSWILRYRNKIMIGSTTDLQSRTFTCFHSFTFGGHSDNSVLIIDWSESFYWPTWNDILLNRLHDV
jgi:hypothetical protein